VKSLGIESAKRLWIFVRCQYIS